MRLQRLTSANFQGAPLTTLTPKGGNMTALGPNGAGKSTIASMVTWLLIGIDVLGRANFDIKPIDDCGNVVHNLETFVEGEFVLADHETRTYKRVYKENWVTKKGKAVAEFSGHETLYYIDDVPKSQAEYQASVFALCPEKWLRSLLIPGYFIQTLDKKVRRALLMEICGDVSDLDVIDCSADLQDLPDILEKRTVEDHVKVLKGRRGPLNDEIRATPTRIDEAIRSLLTVAPGDHVSEVQLRQARLKGLQERRSAVRAGGRIAELRSESRRIQSERDIIASRLRNVEDPARSTALSEKRRLTELESDHASRVRILQRDLFEKKNYLSTVLEVWIADLLALGAKELAKTFEGEDTCPSCGQSLPAEKLQAAREEFNLAQAEQIDKIKVKGKELRAKEATIKQEIETLAASLAKATEAHEATKAQLAAIIIPEIKSVDPETNDEYKSFGVELAAIDAEIAKLTANAGSATEEIDAEIATVEALIRDANAAIAAAKQNEGTEARIAELRKRQKALAKESEELERQMFLCEEFWRVKCSLLNDRINRHFDLCRFQLFENQINGGLAEVCNVTFEGAEPSNGQMINCGLDAINAISRHIGFSAPIIVDNAEAVTDLLRTDGQQLRFVVAGSPGDPLRFAYEDAPAKSPSAPKELAETSSDKGLF